MAENEEELKDQAPAPPMEETGVSEESEKKEKKSMGARDKSWRNRNLQAGAIGFLSALLVCALMVGSFAIGYAVGDRGDRGAMPGNGQMMQGVGQTQQGAGQRMVGLQEDLGVNIIRGKATSVSADKITVNSLEGDQTVKITSNTIYNGDKEIAEGDQVLVMVKEADGQEAEAVSITILGENANAAPGNQGQAPGNQGMQPGQGNIQQQGQSNI